ELTLAGSLTENIVTGIFAASLAAGPGGSSGKITLDVAHLLTISGGAEISSSTSGLGKGGDILVNAGQVIINESSPASAIISGIFADTYSGGAGGAAG